MKVVWSEKFESGIDWLDRQHHELIDLVAKLVKEMEQGGGGIETIRVLKFLENYVVVHFDSEERDMELTAYPEMDEHKKEHAAFARIVKAFKEELDTRGATHYLTIRSRNAIVDWLTNHIAVSDQRMAAYVKGHKERETAQDRPRIKLV